MPSPVGHSLAGMALFWFETRKKVVNWKVVLTAIVAASLPDGDFLFGFVMGSPNEYHHQFTHSIIFVMLAGLLLALLFRPRRGREFYFRLGIFVSMGLLHLFLDAACVDTNAPYGLQLLWPFSKEYFIFPITPLLDMQRASDSATFFQSMFNWHNFKTVALEILLFSPLVLIGYIWRKRTLRG